MSACKTYCNVSRCRCSYHERIRIFCSRVLFFFIQLPTISTNFYIWILVLIYLNLLLISSMKMSFPFYILLSDTESSVTFDEDWLYVKSIFGRYQAQRYPIPSAHNTVKFLLLRCLLSGNHKNLYEKHKGFIRKRAITILFSRAFCNRNLVTNGFQKEE